MSRTILLCSKRDRRKIGSHKLIGIVAHPIMAFSRYPILYSWYLSNSANTLCCLSYVCSPMLYLILFVSPEILQKHEETDAQKSGETKDEHDELAEDNMEANGQGIEELITSSVETTRQQMEATIDELIKTAVTRTAGS